MREVATTAYHVVEAEDGQHGLALIEKEQPEVALIDLSLPLLDGFELIQRLRARPELKRLPIVVLTAHADPADEVRARAAGADEYLTKPVERDRLIATLDRVRDPRAVRT